MAVRVEIENLSNVPYSEYFLTGFYILEKQRIIDEFNISYAPGFGPGRIHRFVNHARKKIGWTAPSSGDDWSHVVGTIRYGSKKRKFAINVLDTPWDFSSRRFIENADVYFKCQYPKDFRKGFVQLSRQSRIVLPQLVVEQSHKVKPLMLGRPLSRCMDFNKNIKILRVFEKGRRVSARKYNLLVYFGMAYDDIDIPNSHHPHLKRAQMAVWVKDNIPDAKVILGLAKQDKFLGQLGSEALRLENRKRIGDKHYLDLVQGSFSTLNITGLRGSIPFRVIDSFLSGMVLISDNMCVDWYDPLVPGRDFLSVGDLGYELLQDIDLEKSCQILKNHVNDIEREFRDTIDYRDSRFKQFYSPESVASYILNETETS